MTADCRIKTWKNWLPASSDEDLVMRSKRQNKVLKFQLWYMSFLLHTVLPTKWIHFSITSSWEMFCCVEDYYQQQSAGPPPGYTANVHPTRLPYVAYGVPPRPNFHGAVNMYAHPQSPALASPTSPPATWRPTYVPQQLPVMNHRPLHVSHNFLYILVCSRLSLVNWNRDFS